MSESNATVSKDSTDLYIGVQVELNQQAVTLAPKTPVNKIDEKGLELGLAKPLNLGKLGPAMKSISEDLSVPKEAMAYFDADADQRKKIGFAPLDNFIGKVLNADLTIEALDYKKPPKNAKDAQSEYLFAASATWDGEADSEKYGTESDENEDFFKLKGIFVVVAKGMPEEKVSSALTASLQRIAGGAETKALPAASKEVEVESKPADKDGDHAKDSQSDKEKDGDHKGKTE